MLIGRTYLIWSVSLLLWQAIWPTQPFVDKVPEYDLEVALAKDLITVEEVTYLGNQELLITIRNEHKRKRS